jgi:hypothetical protein
MALGLNRVPDVARDRRADLHADLVLPKHSWCGQDNHCGNHGRLPFMSLLRIAVLVQTSFELARAEYSIMANMLYLTTDEYAMYRAGHTATASFL